MILITVEQYPNAFSDDILIDHRPGRIGHNIEWDLNVLITAAERALSTIHIRDASNRLCSFPKKLVFPSACHITEHYSSFIEYDQNIYRTTTSKNSNSGLSTKLVSYRSQA